MDKAPDAYRTISEVAEDLDLPQHVLRFWETRFPQIRPLKRGGGRRYYRPDDVELLKGIRHLLYKEGYTIKGVQRILKEQGVKAVLAFVRETLTERAEIEVPLPPARTETEFVLMHGESNGASVPAPAANGQNALDEDRLDDDDDVPFDLDPPAVAPSRPQAIAPVIETLAAEIPAIIQRPAAEPVAAPVAPIVMASDIIRARPQVSMFRGGLKREEPIGHFDAPPVMTPAPVLHARPAASMPPSNPYPAASVPAPQRESVLRDPVPAQEPALAAPADELAAPVNRDALLLALEDLLACRVAIDRVLARRITG